MQLSLIPLAAARAAATPRTGRFESYVRRRSRVRPRKLGTAHPAYKAKREPYVFLLRRPSTPQLPDRSLNTTCSTMSPAASASHATASYNSAPVKPTGMTTRPHGSGPQSAIKASASAVGAVFF